MTAFCPSKLTDSHYWLALKFIPRLNILRKIELVERYSLYELFHTPPDNLQTELTAKQYLALSSPDWQRVDQIIVSCKSQKIQVITFSDKRYPLLLKEIYDPPLVLFVNGDARLLNSQQLAIVGSRGATLFGLEQAKYFAAQLSSKNLIVTSGLALGVDTAAHRGALLSSGLTVAVVASGLDIVYPARNKALAKEIVERGGAIVSEVVPGTQPKAGLFPRRNRLISGMSIAVLVVEAEIRSGSLITARCALEHNRDVFAIPGSINNPMVKGCHYLIKQGAKLIDDVADIVDELDLNINNGLNLNEISDKEKGLEKSHKEVLCIDSLLASVGYEITPVDVVVSRSKLPTEVVLTRLTMLELRGLVSAVPGGYLRVN